MPGTAAGTVRRSSAAVASATSPRASCSVAAVAGSTMFGFSSMPSSATRCPCSAAKTACSVVARDLGAALDRVVAVHQHLGLDDRHDARPPGRAPRSARARGRWPRCSRGSGCRSPIAITARHLAKRAPSGVLGQALAQAVEALGDLLAAEAGQRLRARVDLDAGDDARSLEQLRERRAVGGAAGGTSRRTGYAADVLGGALGREQQLAQRAADLLGRLDAGRLQALVHRAVLSSAARMPLPSATSRWRSVAAHRPRVNLHIGSVPLRVCPDLTRAGTLSGRRHFAGARRSRR